MIHARFQSMAVSGGWNVGFAHPLATRSAESIEEVLPLIDFAETAARRGHWVALLLSYEAAPAFDPALKTHPAGLFPLVWAAVFDRAQPAAQEPATGPAPTGPWRPMIERAAYETAFGRIKDYIARGDTYQVNLTFPTQAPFPRDGWPAFLSAGQAQRAAWSVFLDMGRFQVLSFSPELFFEWRDGRIRCRPMKGTMARGRWDDEDEERARALSDSGKDRAENLMITDMVRNDLGRIARVGSVKTTRLFEVERYPTLFQMTSTVEAEAGAGVSLADVFRALFPGASVTGAPKVRAMEIIRELEPHPRGLYTGAIGVIEPGGAAVFNLPIRTAVADRTTGRALFHVGGGITWDSTAEGEYGECLLKASFLAEPPDPFELLETMRLEAGAYRLLERHLDRLRRSACYFDYPLDEPLLRRRLTGIAENLSRGLWKVRLLLAADGRIRLEPEPFRDDTAPWLVALSETPVDSRDRFLFHKTTRRAVYDSALARHPGGRDVILWNERGEVTESCLANVVAVLDGRPCTPPRSCGLLAGVEREEGLVSGEWTERVLSKDDLLRAETLFLVNSVRGRIDIRLAG